MLYLHLIWRQITIVASHLGTIFKIIWLYARSHRLIAGGAVVVLVAVIATLFYFFGGTDTVATLSDARSVTIIRVGDTAAVAPLSLIGTVRATREALVAPDTSGTVSGIYRSLGDYVGAGTIIAELKNDTQRAVVAQARAALQKTESSVAVGGIGVGTAQSSYLAAQDSARATIQSAYSTIDDSIRRKADQVFSNPTGGQPKFNISTSNAQLVTTSENGRLSMQPILARHEATTPTTMGTDALLVELATLSNEVKLVQTFMQNLVLTLNASVTTYNISDASIALYRADASAGLASINALSSTLVATIDNLKTRRSAVEIAETGLATGTTGESADIAGAQANLAIALAGLEKTLIRAPISGTINRLDLDVGSFVNASQPVIYITNAGGLEAVVYVSGNDLKDVSVGSKATVAATVQGEVVRVAAALDPVTKKAEIRVSIPPSAPLVAGQSATVAIERSTKPAQSSAVLAIPLSAVKITPDGPLVFTLNDESVLVANPVVLGTLRGASVQVTSGITVDSVIVEDARGLKEGQKVLVD